MRLLSREVAAQSTLWYTRQHMKKPLSYGLLLLGGLVLAALVLETGDRFYWRWMVSKPHLTPPEESGAWQHVSQEKDASVLPGNLNGDDTICPPHVTPVAANPVQDGPPPKFPAPEEDLGTRVARFLALPEEAKAFFDVIGRRGYCCTCDGIIERAYMVEGPAANRRANDWLVGKPVSEAWGPDSIAQIRRVCAEKQPVQVLLPDVICKAKDGLDVILAPKLDVSGNVTGVYGFGSPHDSQPPDSMWISPFYRYKPGAVSGDGQLAINNFGFRGDDVEVPKPPTTYRILCLGESTTLEGITNADTWPGLLEARLRKCFDGYKHIEVVNCGIPGTYSFMHRARLLDYLAMQPDLVILYIAANDTYQFRLREWKEAMTPWQRRLSASGLLRHHWNGLFLPSRDAMRQRIRETMIADCRTMFEWTRRHGVDFALCSVAYPSRLTFLERAEFEHLTARFNAQWTQDTFTFATYCRVLDETNACVRDFCGATGCLYVPVQENVRGGFEYFADITHMWLKGRQLKARVIFDAVKDFIAERVVAREK